jgi:hypothetical protein
MIITHKDYLLVKHFRQFMYTYIHPCSSLKADWVFLFTSWLEKLELPSHANGLAWLFLARLAQILLPIKGPNSNTYKSHRYTSELKQHKAQHSDYNMHILAFFPTFCTAELKRPAGTESFCRAQYLHISCKKRVLLIYDYLTLIRAAGGVYDFQNFEEV